MLERASFYKDQLLKFVTSAKNEEYLKYYFGSRVCDTISSEEGDDDWNKISRVSLSDEGEVLGYISAKVNRSSFNVHSLTTFAIKRYGRTFRDDILQYIDNLFSLYQFNKLAFTVFVGNPAEKIWDKMTISLGGRIVGIEERESRLLDGKYYDNKIYEIMKDRYTKIKNGRTNEKV